MSSWRDASDPECPECGEPISATSQYCMHCGTDFGGLDDSADVSDADDVSTSGPTTGSDSGDAGGPLDRLSEFLGGPGRDARDESAYRGRETDEGSPRGETAGNATTAEATTSDGTATTTDSTPTAGSTTEAPGAGAAVEKAPLSIRGFTAFVVSIPVTLVAFFILVALGGSVLEGLGGLLFVAIWGATLAYLVRKPLPSDIIGDAFYVLAGLLLAGPALGYAIMVVRAAVTSRTLEDSLGALVTELLIIEFFIMWPAAFLAAIGYAGNWWARKQLSESGA